MKSPTFEEVASYCEEKHCLVDPVAFFLHYETNGWMVGKVPMKNWRAGVANWDRMQQTRNGGNGHARGLPETFAERDERSSRAAFERARQDRLGFADDVPPIKQSADRRKNQSVAPGPRLLSRGGD